jgi:23S rRNA pseudouridine1911/1915/1917 synthase
VTVRRERIRVPPPGGRLDHVLVERLPGLSRSRLQALIRDGALTVDDRPITKPGHRLEGGELLQLSIPRSSPSAIEPESIPLDVIFESDDVLIVNKPAGMVVHPAVGHARGTLVHAALGHAPDMVGVGGETRPGVVHRLDKDTSGLILLAKHDAAHHALQRHFKDRTVDKTYLALVDGHPPTPSGRIEAPIGRDARHRQRMAVTAPGKGRAAVTSYDTREAFPQHALLEVRPLTGRTHQIRVHLAFLGCPVVGDPVYGRRKPTVPVGRQMLHAWRLRLCLPGEAEARQFEARLPADFLAALAGLRA